MITYDSEHVINRAAGDLGKWVPGEALGSVEHDVISSALDNVLQEVSKIIVIDREAVPSFVFECITVLTAIFAGSAFSNVPYNPDSVEMVEKRLRYLVAQMPTYEPLAIYYF
jgi:hypothetical protein